MGCFIEEEMSLQKVSTSYEDVLDLALIGKVRRDKINDLERVKRRNKSQDLITTRRSI
jgi:hypothetical protein